MSVFEGTFCSQRVTTEGIREHLHFLICFSDELVSVISECAPTAQGRGVGMQATLDSRADAALLFTKHKHKRNIKVAESDQNLVGSFDGRKTPQKSQKTKGTM